MTAPRRARRGTGAAGIAAAAAALSLAAGLGGCGVPLDSSPRAITRATTTLVQATPTTADNPDGESVGVYFLDDDRLVRRSYPVQGTATARQAVGFALDSPAQGSPPNLRTAVPPGTRLRSLTTSGGVATIDLTSEINDVSGPTQKEAFAQLVFTALDFPSIHQVRFLIAGDPVDAPTDDGNLALVEAGNYDPPLNPR